MGRDSAFARRLAELRAERGLSLRALGSLAHFSRGFLWDLEAGNKSPSLASAARLDEALSAGGQLAALATGAVESPLRRLETLRRQVTDTIATNGLSPSGVEYWEQAALEYGRASRDRPPGPLLTDLAADFAELSAQLQRRHTSSALQRLTRVTAQLAGLIFLTLIKLDERTAARNWARTARIAADEARDPALLSWVRAQEAYVYYYSGQYRDAVAVACHAREIAHDGACVGAVLAAALEARALARLGRANGARTAIGAAEAILSDLDADSVTESAFGYNEAQLRFHEGNALTHLGEVQLAWTAQQRALQLYPDSDYLDRTLVHLDRAGCLATDGDPAAAMVYAAGALEPLTDDERRGLLTVRAQEIFLALPDQARALPAAREFRDLLMITAGPERTEQRC